LKNVTFCVIKSEIKDGQKHILQGYKYSNIHETVFKKVESYSSIDIS